jgi:hypothetical protein
MFCKTYMSELKIILLYLVLTFSACTANENNAPEGNSPGTMEVSDSLPLNKIPADSQSVSPGPVERQDQSDSISSEVSSNQKVYANKRFRNVTVEQTGERQFKIKGQGQIFEASFSWVVEDGHEELQKGFANTDAGAPEWGDFSFEVNAPKNRPGSTLHLILFEISAKDGSRQYELPIPLY